MSTRQVLAVVTLGAGLLAAACADERPATRRELRVGIAIPSYVHAVAWIAADRGYFADERLDAEVSVMGGSSATMRALLAGSADVGIAGGDAVLRANAAGAELVVIAGLVNRFYHRIVGRPGLSAPEDLRGATVGLPFLGGPQHVAVLHALSALGLDPERDVRIVNLGKEWNRTAALARGDIDATTSQAPPSLLDEMGLRVLVDLPAEGGPFPYAVVVVRRELLQRDRETVRGALRALCRATAFYRAAENEDESLALIARSMSGTDTTGKDRERYETAGPRLLSWPPRPDAAGFERVARLLSLAGDPAAAIDTTLLDELEASGSCSSETAAP